MRVLRSLLGLFLATLTAGVGLVAWDLHQGLRAADATTHHFDDLVTDISVDYAFKSEQLNHILLASRLTADQAGLLAIEQRRQLNKTSADSDKTVRALRLAIDRAGLLFAHTDEQLNAEALPGITAAAIGGMKAVSSNADKIGASAQVLTARFADPRLDSMLTSFNLAAQNLSGMSAQGNSSMGHVDHMLAYADKQLTTPIGFWKNLLLHEALPAAGSAGSFIQGFIKK